MKKVLFATSALVASAGIASADIKLSGNAEMGVRGSNTNVASTTTIDESKLRFHTDIDVTFKMSGETNNGLSFGAAIDIDEGGVGAAAVANDNDDGGIAVFLSSDFGTITMGDTDGGFDWALAETDLGGAIADDHTSHAGFDGNSGFDGTYDGQIVRYDFTFAGFSVAASAELDDTGNANSGPVFGIGAKYAGDLGGIKLGVGAGFQTVKINANTTASVFGGSVTGEIAGFKAIANFSSFKDAPGGANAKKTVINVGAQYKIQDITIAANYGQVAFEGPNVDNSTGFGASAGYDLGGGASLLAGFGSGKTNGGSSVSTYSLGVKFKF